MSGYHPRETHAGITGSLAGCYVCHGGEAKWQSRNALGISARHHDATGHPTWCEQTLSVRYGAAPDHGLKKPESG